MRILHQKFGNFEIKFEGLRSKVGKLTNLELNPLIMEITLKYISEVAEIYGFEFWATW